MHLGKESYKINWQFSCGKCEEGDLIYMHEKNLRTLYASNSETTYTSSVKI